MGISRGHVKVEDVKKKTEAVVAALNLPIQVVVAVLLYQLIMSLVQLVQMSEALAPLTGCPPVMAFTKTIFQTWKLMENNIGHGPL